MKRVALFALILLICSGIFTSQASAQGEISVLLDGVPVTQDTPPLIKDNRTLVPFRSVAEALGINVQWDGNTKTVIAGDNGDVIKLRVNDKTAYKNDITIYLDVAPVVYEGRTLIPLRFFAEAFNCRVSWDNKNKLVLIYSPPKAMTVTGFYALGDPSTSSWNDLFGLSYPNAGRGNTDAITDLALGWYSLDEQGNLLTQSRTGWQRPEGWETVLSLVGQYQLNTEMVVHLTDYESVIINIIKNGQTRQRAIEAIAAEAAAYGGVNLDFEGLGWQEEGERLEATKKGFVDFVFGLANQLQKDGKTLTLTLHPPNSVYKGYDYSALGQAADRIIIMAYDYGIKPEPLDLVTEAITAAKASVPADKLVLGISIPGETPQSFTTKLSLAKHHNLEGIALWRLGLVSEEMWEIIRKEIEFN